MWILTQEPVLSNSSADSGTGRVLACGRHMPPDVDPCSDFTVTCKQEQSTKALEKPLKAQEPGGVLLRVDIMDGESRGGHEGQGEQQQQDPQSTHCRWVGGCDKGSFRSHNHPLSALSRLRP